MVNELTISFKDGELTGVQVRGADGVARGLQAGDLDAQIEAVNEAALLRIGELEAQLKAAQDELTALKESATKAAKAVVAVVDDVSVSDAATAIAVRTIAVQVLTPVRERERAEAVKKLAEAQAEVDKYVI